VNSQLDGSQQSVGDATDYQQTGRWLGRVAGLDVVTERKIQPPLRILVVNL
jgi:hypothetical protein